MSRQLFISGLTVISLVLTTASTSFAKLAPEVSLLKLERLERSNTSEANKDVRVATASERSMQYVYEGLAAQKNGNNSQALEYYYQALQIDETNAVAFLVAGNLLGNTEEGVMCVKTAAFLFLQQDNQEGYKLAISWLQEIGVTE